jgi:hypothetical protein
MLVAYFTGMKASNSNNLSHFKESLNVNNAKTYQESVLNNVLSFSFIVFLILISVVPALIIALSCNKGVLRTSLVAIFAFFFSDLYLCNYTIRKYLLKEPAYCKL